MSRTRIVVAGSVAAVLAAGGLLAVGSGALSDDQGASPGQGRVVAGADVVSNLVAGRPQSVSARLLPPIAQPGPDPAPAEAAASVVEVQVEPGVGQQVVLQREDGGTWVQAGTARADETGRAVITAPAPADGGPPTLRVLAKPHAGYAEATSDPLPADVWDAPEFADEFDGASLDESRWTHRLQGYLPDSHRKCSRPDPSAVSVADGTAQLQVLADPARVSEQCTRDEDGEEFSYRLNANVGTEGRYSFQYGYAAARVKFQPLRGQHGGFWLQGGKEIDVVEYFGDSHPSPLTSWVYDYATGSKVGAGGGTDGSVQRPRRFGKDWSGRFHVFSVEWTPKEYVFRIDGTEVWRTDELVSQEPEFLVMSLLSSDYYLQHMDESELPQTMYVDWVRVWER